MENIHANHRQRMRDRFKATGFDGFQPHEILEMLLFYSCPRIDTNGLGHELIARFKTLKGVLEADIDELKRVDGIGENSAVLIKLVQQMGIIYINEDTASKSRTFASPEKLRELFQFQFLGEFEECLMVACFGKKLNLLGCERVANGGVSAVGVDIRKVAEAAIRYNSDIIALAHNHPTGTAIASAEDVRATKAVIGALEPLGIHVVDHIIVAENCTMSMRDSGYISIFE